MPIITSLQMKTGMIIYCFEYLMYRFVPTLTTLCIEGARHHTYLLSSDLTALTGLSIACLTAGVGPVLTISGLNAL